MEDTVDASPGEKPKAFKSLLGILEKYVTWWKMGAIASQPRKADGGIAQAVGHRRAQRSHHHLQWPQVERTQGHRVSRFRLFPGLLQELQGTYRDPAMESGLDSLPLALRSSSQRMLKTNSELQEASSGVIDLPDDRADAVNALLWYAYTANYDDTKESSVSDGQLIPRPMLFNVLVHTVGDKYGMRNLCQLAEAKFEKHATTGWRSDGFADAIIEMSLTSPDSKRVLLTIAAEIAITHAADLFTGEETRFQETVRNVAPFAFKVTSILLESRRSNLLVTEKRLRCMICARSFIIDTNPGTTSISCWYCGICQYVDRFEALEI